jgi:hypothetical protein
LPLLKDSNVDTNQEHTAAGCMSDPNDTDCAPLFANFGLPFGGKPAADLEAKLREFQNYFNAHRTHAGLKGRPPDSGGPGSPISFASYRWQKHCRELYQTYQTPIAV